MQILISSRTLAALASIVVLAVSIPELSAATQTWTGSVDGNWSTSANNWNGGVPWTNNNLAVFPVAGANQSITIASGVSVQNTTAGGTDVMLISGGSYTFGGSALTIGTSAQESYLTTTGTGSAIFSVNIDYSVVGGNLLRIRPNGGSITFNNGINAGAHQLQFGFFSTGSAINLSGGSFTTTGNITSTHSPININGTAAVSAGAAWAQNAGTVTVNSATASLSFAGDANSSVIGRSQSATSFNLQNGTVTSSGGFSVMNGTTSINNLTSTLNVSGGTLTATGNGITLFRNGQGAADTQGTAAYTQSGGVVTTTGITFGRGTAVTASTAASASLSLSGGELYVGATGIVKTAGNTALTTSITLSGGTLGASAGWSSAMAMTLSNANGGVQIKAANAANTAQNITISGSLSGNAGFTKTGGGTLTLSGVNTYTGNTVVNAGALTLSDNAKLAFDIDASGVNNSISGTGTVTLDGDFVFDLAGAAAVGTWNIVDVGTLSETFGSTFTVDGWTDNLNNTWSTTSGGSTYTFDEATGVLLAVPEPNAWLLLVGSGLSCLMLRRRRAA